MKSSIIVTVYNGGKYILEQLNSLMNQTVEADEVIIIDDCSVDESVFLIKKFIESNNLKKWKLKVNRVQKGWKYNFWYGFRMCENEIIFPCDQDDIWELNKIEVMKNILEKDMKINLLVSNYEPFYETGSVKIAKKYTKHKNSFKCEKIPFSKNFSYTLRPGCTYAFKKSFFLTIDRYWKSKFAHDTFLWRMAMILDSLYIIEMPLIKFRRHANNSSSPYHNRTLDESINIMIENLAISEKCVELLYDIGEFKYSSDIKNLIHFYAMRIKLYSKKSVLIWIVIFMRYHKFFLTTREILGDLYVVIKR